MMTKQEEREALKKIEKIIKAAGPDSYIGMAFDGCCELARTNIENDFGCSMQDNIDTWRRNAEKEHEMRIECQDLISVLNSRIESHIAEKDSLREQLKDAKDMELPGDLFEKLTEVLQEQVSVAESRIAHCVDILADFADYPKDIAVANALKGLSAAREQKAKYSGIIEELLRYKYRK